MSIENRTRLFRSRDTGEKVSVTNIELFFDLVFVFAITQLSHRLISHLSLVGAIETMVLFGAVWWLWIYTSWATNWLDPEHGFVRSMLMCMMMGMLLLSAAIPKAFDAGAAWAGIVFAAAYVGMQLTRTLIVVWASWGHQAARMRNFMRIGFYFLLAAPLWIAGALAHPDTRLWLWAFAVAVEYAGPVVMFRTPLIGRSTVEDWDISGAHMAERCALFIIIALGEAILVTGATFAKLEVSWPTMAAFATSFIGSAAMWWIYFDTGQKRGTAAIEEGGATDVGRLARSAYTYMHMPIVAGILFTAVADELVLKHPQDHATVAFVLLACGGPGVFLVGNLLFKWTTADRPNPPLSHGIGIALLLVTALAALPLEWSPLTIMIVSTFALLATAAWEWFSLNGGWQRWTPWVSRRAAIALQDSER